MDSPFYTWLSQQATRTDNIGLIARLVALDRHFPRQDPNLHQLLRYYDRASRSLHSQLFQTYAHRSLIKKAHREWRNQPEPAVIRVKMTYEGKL